jgi:hypothetical protein
MSRRPTREDVQPLAAASHAADVFELTEPARSLWDRAMKRKRGHHVTTTVSTAAASQ